MKSNQKVFLVRHLPTENNLSGIYMGRTFNKPILENSIYSFEVLLKTTSFSNNLSLFSSPAQRCIQTANIFKKVTKNPTQLNINKNFQEVDYGDFEGKNLDQIKKMYPRQYNMLISNPSKLQIPNGESFENVQKRAWNELQKITEVTQNDIVIFTHVDIIKFIIFQILGTSIDYKKVIYINNGSISCLEKFHDSFKLDFLNLSTASFIPPT